MREKHGTRFGLVSILNHWIVAILFLSVLSLGFILDFFGGGRALRGPWMEAHKAAGVILLMFAIWRICWRLIQGFPKDSSPMPAWQHISAKLVHWLLLFAIVAMPISGILLSLYGERGINVFGLFVISPRPENDFISNVSSVIHEVLAYLVSAVIFMHVGAVVKHHFIDKDDTLQRMLSTKAKAVAAQVAKPLGKNSQQATPQHKPINNSAVPSAGKFAAERKIPQPAAAQLPSNSAPSKIPVVTHKVVNAATEKAQPNKPTSAPSSTRKTTLAERIPNIQKQLANNERVLAEKKLAAEKQKAAEKPVPLKVRLATKGGR